MVLKVIFLGDCGGETIERRPREETERDGEEALETDPGDPDDTGPGPGDDMIYVRRGTTRHTRRTCRAYGCVRHSKPTSGSSYPPARSGEEAGLLVER